MLTRSPIWVIHRSFSHALGPQNSHKIAFLLKEHGYLVEEIHIEQVSEIQKLDGHIWCDLALKEVSHLVALLIPQAKSLTWIDNSQPKSLEDLKELALDHAISLAESEFISSK